MREPLVSALMMTYNHIAYIAQAIEGVLRQKVSFPIELVIGEDCSTDGTREVALEYQQRYPDIIRVLAWEKNVGITRNAYDTTKASSGKYSLNVLSGPFMALVRAFSKYPRKKPEPKVVIPS